MSEETPKRVWSKLPWYWVKMDDGKILSFQADDAGRAMFMALGAHLGHRVIQIRRGNSSDGNEFQGRLYLDVPPHKPLKKLLVPIEDPAPVETPIVFT